MMKTKKNGVLTVPESRTSRRLGRLGRPVGRSIVTAFCVVLASLANAQTAEFPKANPVFTVAVPNDFNIEFKNDEMWIRAGRSDEIAYFMFRELPQAEVFDRASALKFIEAYAWAQIRSMGITDGRFRMAGNASVSEGINGFDILLQGTWNEAPGGSTKVSYHATAFSADATQYFLLVSLGRWTSTADRDREKELEKSMRAVKRAVRTVGFPKDDPVFTILLSEPWEADTRKDDSMIVSSANGEDITTLWQKAKPRAGTTLDTDAGREAFTVSWAEGIAKQLQMSDLKRTVPVTATIVAAHKAFTTTYEGQIDGRPTMLDVIVFTPNGRTYFFAYGVAGQETEKAALEHQRDIVASIKPVGRHP